MSAATDEPDSGGASPRRYGGVSADERRAQRRERLIEAGFEVFGREGYLQSTMRLVCANARLSERYFYENFESLEELFRAVHRRASSKVGEQVMIKLAGMRGADGVAMTRAGLVTFFEMVQADPRLGRVMLTDAVTTGMTNPQILGTRAAAWADMIRDRLAVLYPEMRQELDVDYLLAGFGGVVVQVGAMWMDRKGVTP
ncbi:MAG: hypothetical protein RI907_3230, partial [Pseudomonadota bacterium]